jgi:hypothetical protein
MYPCASESATHIPQIPLRYRNAVISCTESSLQSLRTGQEDKRHRFKIRNNEAEYQESSHAKNLKGTAAMSERDDSRTDFQVGAWAQSGAPTHCHRGDALLAPTQQHVEVRYVKGLLCNDSTSPRFSAGSLQFIRHEQLLSRA